MSSSSELSICEARFQCCEFDETSLFLSVESAPSTVDRNLFGVEFAIPLRVKLAFQALVRYEVISANVCHHQGCYM
jgi:hypothetical protein